MKSTLLILISLLAFSFCHAQSIPETYLDTMDNGRMAAINDVERGTQIGLEIFATDSTPAKRLLITEMDIPFVEHYPYTVDASIDHQLVMDVFFNNPLIDVWGTCNGGPIKPFWATDTIPYTEVSVDPIWHYSDNSILIRFMFEFIYLEGDEDKAVGSGPAINLFREYDLSGNFIQDYVLTGLGNEEFKLSKNGDYALVTNGVLGESASWAPCNNGYFLLWDLKNRKEAINISKFDRSNSLTEKGYRSQIYLRGNTLIEEFWNGVETIDSSRNYRIIDTHNNNRSLFFSIPIKSTRTLSIGKNKVSYIDHATGRKVERLFDSSFFHQN